MLWAGRRGNARRLVPRFPEHLLERRVSKRECGEQSHALLRLATAAGVVRRASAPPAAAAAQLCVPVAALAVRPRGRLGDGTFRANARRYTFAVRAPVRQPALHSRGALRAVVDAFERIIIASLVRAIASLAYNRDIKKYVSYIELQIIKKHCL